METSHVSIIRKNLLYLKEQLEAGDALDHLYQEGVFTQSECSRCKQAGHDKCGTLLELLMKKGEEAYKSICAFLDEYQPHIKEQLDVRSSAEGKTNLLFVNKLKVEQEHKRYMSAKEKIIEDLKDENEKVKEDLASKQEEVLKAKTAKEKEVKKHEAKLQKRKHEIEQLEKREGDREDEMRTLKTDIDQLKTALVLEKEKYEALNGLVLEHEDEEQEQRTDIKIKEHKEFRDACIFRTETTCDQSQLMLLPCLHAACKPCIDHHTERYQEKLLCPCGVNINVKMEELLADHVRENEAAYNLTEDSNRKCSYIEHKDNEEAAAYCQVCDDFFCLECRVLHEKPRVNKQHKITEVKDMETVPIQKWLEETTCKDHPDQKLNLFDSNCKKSICMLCSYGTHKHPDNEDLQLVFQQRRSALEEVLRGYQSHLKNIRERTQVIESHRVEQDKTVKRLESEVASIHQKMAGKFLHRQKQLLKDIRQSLEGQQNTIQEKLMVTYSTENSVMSTIAYINRALESTRKAELISLTAAIEKKYVEDMKVELPSDDTRDTTVILSFQGQKALEELIDEFGSLATYFNKEEIVDCQPTLRELHRDKNAVATKLELTTEELQNTQMKMNDLKEALSVRDKKIEKIRKEAEKQSTMVALGEREIGKIQKEKTKLTQALALRDKEIEEVNEEKNKLTQMLASRDREILERRKENEKLTQTMAHRDREILGLKDKDREIEKIKKELKDKDREIEKIKKEKKEARAKNYPLQWAPKTK